MTLRTPAWRMADRLTDGRLEEIMRQRYDAGEAWEHVARDLYAEHGVTVTGQTLRRWAELLGIVDAKAAS